MYKSVHVEKTRFYFKTLIQEKMTRLNSTKVITKREEKVQDSKKYP